jgi:hypothetical protein
VSIESDLYSYLSTYAGLIPLVGDRIYPLVAPQSVQAPYCTYQKISSGRQYSHSGFSNLSRPRMQVSCFAPTYLQAKAVAIQVIAAIEAWPGSGSVQAAFTENEQDLYDPDTKLYYIPVDFFVYYG